MIPESVLYILISFPLGFLGTLLAIYIGKKWMFSEESIYNAVFSVVNHSLNDEKMVKQLYFIGAVVGNGIRQGVGIGAKGGKFKWEDLFAQVASGFLEQFIKPKQPEQEAFKPFQP